MPADEPDRTTDLTPRDTSRTADQTGDYVPVPASGFAAAVPVVPGYEIEGVLGRGGMGVVYQAQHLALKRTVALKMVLARGHAGPRELARFQIEAEAVARLQHPNIVQIHEFGDADGHPYCALEYVAGGTLARRLGGRPMPPRDAAKLVETLARAMQLAHSRNVVHRDLKPANVLLAADGTPKISDFGLARQLDADSGETQAGAVMGTPSYMAPEQASGRAHDAGPPADVYALGAILYDCLAGHPPFKGKTVVETLDQVRTQEPVPPSRRHPGVPPDLETITLKCLRKEPEGRYASAVELADDLARYYNGEPILARPVGPAERAVKWVRRRPAPAALVAAVALLLVGTTSFSLLFAEHERAASEVLGKSNRALIHEQGEKDAALKAVRVGAARLALNRALILCDQGDVGRGVVALTRALAAAVEAGDADLESAVRLNLAAWERQAWHLRAVLPAPAGTAVMATALNPEGTVVAVALADQTVQLWDATAGHEGRVLHVLPHPGDAGNFYYGVAFSADGRFLLTRTDHAVHVWAVATGRPAGPPLRHESRVSAVAIDAAGRTVLTGDETGAARLWDAATGRPRGEPFVHKTPVSAVAFRADGAQALTASREGHVQTWNVPAGRADGPAFALKGWVSSVRFGRDGKTVLAGTRSLRAGAVHLLDAATGAPVVPPLACDGPVEEAVFGPGETTVAVRTGLGAVAANARVWHVGTGLPVAPLAHPGDVLCFAPNPDGGALVTAGTGGAVTFWDTGRGVPAGPPLYHPRPVRAVVPSRDGRTLLTWDGDVRLWRAPRGVLRATLKHTDQVNAVTFSRDGTLALTGSNDRTAQLWHTKTGQPAAEPLRHEGIVMAVAVSPDGRLALTGDTKARLWDTATGRLHAVLEGHRQVIAAVAFTPDGATALTGSFDGTARLWTVATGRPLGDPLTHGGAVTAVALSPDGQTVLTGSDDKTARLWRVATRQPVGEPLAHPHPIESVAFSHDGRTVFTGGRFGRQLRRWDAATSQPLPDLIGHQDGIWALAAPPASRLLLSGGADRTARFWNTETGEPIGLPLQHQDTVRDVAFGPDGRTALTGSYDTTARRWHAPSGIPIGPPFPHRGKVRAVALSSDGRTAGTACWDGTATLWEAPPAWPGAPEGISYWAQAVIGIKLDDGGGVRTVDGPTWRQLRQQLAAVPVGVAE